MTRPFVNKNIFCALGKKIGFKELAKPQLKMLHDKNLSNKRWQKVMIMML